MSARTNVCRDCGFSNPRSWRTCARCTARLDATAAAPLPLIGHASAAEVIRASIDCAFSMGATTVVAIEGMNGSGKSRLLTHAGEFGARANDGMPLLHTTAGAGGTASPYDPFSTMLLERFGVLPNAPAAAVRGHMFTVVSECLSTSDAVTIAETTHLLGYIAGVEFPDSPFLMPLADRPLELRRRAAQAFRQFVEADVQRAPVLMLIDEAHRMEEPAWQLLRMLFDVEGHLAIVLAGNAPLADRTRTFGPANRTETCVIAPLAHDDVAAMLMVLLPTLESAPEPLVSALHHRSGGNPSVLRAMVLSLVEQGLFEDRDGALVANLARLEDASLPITLDDVIAARIARLSDEERTILTHASVVGDRFWDGAVLAQMRWEAPTTEPKGRDSIAALADQSDRRHVGHVLETLTAKGFLAHAPASVLPGAAQYTFQLPRVRETLYDGLDEDTKVVRHTAVAGWLAVTAEIQREGIAALIAPHLEEAGWLHRAGRAYFEAAAYERARLRTHSALAYIERAIPLIPDEDVVRRIDALHEQGSLLATLGRYDEARQAFTAMLEHAHRIGARSKAAAALNRIGRIHRERGEEETAETVLTSALELFRAAGDLRGVAATLDDLAQVVRLRGDLATALPLAAEALELRRANADMRGEAVSLTTLGTIELGRGRLDAAELYFTQARERHEELGDRLGVMRSHNALGVLAYENGDVSHALEAWASALTLAREFGARRDQCFLLNNLGQAHLTVGDLDAATERLNEAHRLAAALGDRRALADIVRNQGAVALRRGDSNANELFEEAVRIAEEYGGREAIAHAHRAIADARAAGHDTAGLAERDYVASIDLFRQLGNEREAARSLAAYGRYLAECEHGGRARTTLEEARGILERLGLPELDRVNATLRAIGSSSPSTQATA